VTGDRLLTAPEVAVLLRVSEIPGMAKMIFGVWEDSARKFLAGK
jgi:hypothetical protein